MAYIELRRAGQLLGSFVLPNEITDAQGYRYSIHRILHRGGNGIVFESRKRSPKGELVATCALKFLRQYENTRIDRFNNEVRILRTLNHPRISSYYGEGVLRLGDFDVPWVAVEIGGINLRQHVEQRGALPPGVLKQVVLQMCDAIEHLHQASFIHRDIKPENFVWEPQSNTEIMMIDFGIAKMINEDVSARPLDNFTQNMEFVGPVFFSSPELIEYARNKEFRVDTRSDLFQLGKVMWYLSTGKVSAGIPSRRDCPVNGRMHAIVIELLQDDPNDRPQTVAEVRDAVNAI